MKILILDDDENRHTYFRAGLIGHDLTHVTTAEDAIGALKSGVFDAVFLDHDLSVAATLGQPEFNEATGKHVAEFMASLPSRPHVYIHSHNPAGRSSMEHVLKSVGFSVTISPFNTRMFR